MRLATVFALATRYTFAQGGRRYLSTFLSSLSMLGLVLAVALLITVLSVMNGFDKEMRERILALVPHVTLYAQRPVLPADPALTQVLDGIGAITSYFPFVSVNGLLMREQGLETAAVMGMNSDDVGVRLGAVMSADALARFENNTRAIILGAGLAKAAKLEAGDRFTLIVPPPGGVQSRASPRFEALTVAGIMNSGTELDETAAVVHLATASEMAGFNGKAIGYQLFLKDVFSAPEQAWSIAQVLPQAFYAVDWTRTHGNLYSAIQLSRTLVTLLLLSVIAVAAFNVVSSLVLVVFDKQRDIAILRTMGATPANIAQVFLLQGALIGLVGVLVGSVLGIVLSVSLPSAVAWLEHLLDMRFLSTDVYPVSFLPSQLRVADVGLISAVAWLMCVLSALYPARRAAKLAPALILHQE